MISPACTDQAFQKPLTARHLGAHGLCAAQESFPVAHMGPESHSGRRWVSLVGAAMSALYSIITFGASLAVYLSNPVAPSYAPKSGDSTADEVFGILNAIGGLVFAYGGQVVLLEIQVSAGAYVQGYNLPESEAVECCGWAAALLRRTLTS